MQFPNFQIEILKHLDETKWEKLFSCSDCPPVPLGTPIIDHLGEGARVKIWVRVVVLLALIPHNSLQCCACKRMGHRVP